MSNTTAAEAGENGFAALQCKTVPPRRILVAEDETVIRLMITAALVRSGYEVDTAQDGAVAWAALQAKHYDLLITDNSMPKITGIGLVKRLRGHASTLPVVMATGATPTEDLKRYPRLGISAILLKPYTTESLLKTVRKTLREAESTPLSHCQLLLFPDNNISWPPLAIHPQLAAEQLAMTEAPPRL
jgi:DNA-binding response OmpR family regulator